MTQIHHFDAVDGVVVPKNRLPAPLRTRRWAVDDMHWIAGKPITGQGDGAVTASREGVDVIASGDPRRDVDHAPGRRDADGGWHVPSGQARGESVTPTGLHQIDVKRGVREVDTLEGHSDKTRAAERCVFKGGVIQNHSLKNGVVKLGAFKRGVGQINIGEVNTTQIAPVVVDTLKRGRVAVRRSGRR